MDIQAETSKRIEELEKEIKQLQEDYLELDKELRSRNTVANICNNVLEKFGANVQEDICIEELSELQKSILKHRRAGTLSQGNLETTLDGIIEEIADVKISMVYLELIYEKICPDFSQRIDKAMKCKIDRTAERYLREDD